MALEINMRSKTVREIMFLDDCKDEALITKILLRKSFPEVECQFFLEPSHLYRELDGRSRGKVRMPDIIAVDLNMPCSPGTEIVRTLKQNAALDETAVGVCTGSLDPKDKERAHKSGADFYVVKPFDEAKLNEVQLQYAAKRPAA